MRQLISEGASRVLKFTLFLWLLEILFMLNLSQKLKNLVQYDTQLHIFLY